jgi:hypothetical protein
MIQELLPGTVNVADTVEDVYEAVQYQSLSVSASLCIHGVISFALSE